MCLIENLEIFMKSVKNTVQNSKFILTALEYDYNEIFKFFTAKSYQGYTIFAIQHGNANFTMIIL